MWEERANQKSNRNFVGFSEYIGASRHLGEPNMIEVLGNTVTYRWRTLTPKLGGRV